MRRVTLRGLLARKRRLVGTFLATFLGIAFLTGTLVLGDTLRRNFDNLFADANAGTDVVVRSTARIDAGPARGPARDERGLVPASLAERIRAVDGVAAAEPSIEGYGQLVGRDGTAVGGNGPPRRAGAWMADPELNPYRLVEGRAPQADGEVVVNRGAAKEGKLRVGDVTTVQTPEPVRVTVVGIATFGSADGFGRSTYAAFSLAGAEAHIAHRSGVATTISVRAAPGVSQAELADRVRAVLPAGTEAVTGAQFTSENQADLSGRFLNVFTTMLTVFAGIALVVATFSIHNTFSILVAQRTRESALLRALGATRRQVLASVMLEALAIGVAASAAGLLGGIGVAGLLKGLFDGFGFALPAGGLVLRPYAVAVALGVGVAVTLVAAAFPARRGARVAPVAALREHAAEPEGVSRWRAVAGAAMALAGVGVVLAAVLGGEGNVLAPAGAGALLTLLGVVVIGPVAARPAARALGWPAARWRGVAGRLARGNAGRNPRRTSATASALLVGVAVVSLFTVFGASIKASIDRTVSASFGGDLVVTPGGFGGFGFSPALARDLDALPEVATAAGIGQGAASVGGKGVRVSVADPPALATLLDLDVRSGTIGGLTPAQLAVSSSVARSRGWQVGSPVAVSFVDGTTAQLTVGAVFAADGVVGGYLLPRATWSGHAAQEVDREVLVALAPGVRPAAGRAAVERVTAGIGGAEVLDRKGYIANTAQGVDMMLGIVYVLLFLAIVIALMGISNTLSLAVHERTRELGLLRAVGSTPRQVRSMVRWESVVVALFGTLGGLGLGVFLGWALVRAAGAADVATFTAPPGRLALVVVAGAVAGVLAGMRPARRAARLDVLAAVTAP